MCFSTTFWQERIASHIDMIEKLQSDQVFLNDIEKVAHVILTAFRAGNKLLICGNGGSAADSQHIAAELVGRFYLERKPLPAEALTANTSCLTAVGNDYSYDEVFSRQIEAKGVRGDLLLGISTSGNSKNVVKAMRVANQLELITIGLTGDTRNCELSSNSDYCICAPSLDTPRIQEAHILIAHMLCEFIESELFGAALEANEDSHIDGVETRVIAA